MKAVSTGPRRTGPMPARRAPDADTVPDAARPTGWHRPIDFPSWSITCTDLVAAIAAGPGLVVLVGPAESGKSMTVAALAAGAADGAMNIRRTGQQIQPGTTVDVVDPVVDDRLDDLVRPARAPTAVRVLAARPDQLQPILDRAPGVRVVHMRPLTPRDRRAFIEARRTQRRRSGDARMNRAMAVLVGYNITTPGALDRMIDQVFDLVPAKLRPERAEGASLLETLVSARERSLAPDAATHSLAVAEAMGGPVRGPRSRLGRSPAAFGDSDHPVPSTIGPAERNGQAGPGFPPRRGQTFEAPSWDMMQSSGGEIVHDAPARRRPVRMIAACAAVVLLAAGGIAGSTLWANRQAAPPERFAMAATPIQTAQPPTPAPIAMPIPLPPAPVPPAPSEPQIAAGPAVAEPGRPDAALTDPAREASVVEADPAIAAAPSSPDPAPLGHAAAPLSPAPALAGPSASAGPMSPSPASGEPPLAASPSAARPELGRSPPAPQPAPSAAAIPTPPAHPPGTQQPAPVQVMAENATHLLRLGKALMSIGQQADGERLLAASAELGNAEAGGASIQPIPRPAHEIGRPQAA